MSILQISRTVEKKSVKSIRLLLTEPGNILEAPETIKGTWVPNSVGVPLPPRISLPLKFETIVSPVPLSDVKKI